MTEKTANILTKIVVPAVLAIGLIIVCFWGMEQSAAAESYRTEASNIYTHAFLELADNLSNMSIALGKLRVVASPQQYVLLLDDIWRLSGSSVSLMSEIPSSHIDTKELNSFIVRVGDFAHSLTKKAISGVMLSDDDMGSINSLYETCTALADEHYQRIQAGDIPTAAMTADGYYTGASDVTQDSADTHDANQTTEQSADSADEEYEDDDSISKFPTLIYDGPYSESSEKLAPRGLSGADVTESDAMNIAKQLLSLNDISSLGLIDGNIPCYDLSGAYEDSRTVDISITKQGGKLLYLMSSASGSKEGAADNEEYTKLKTAAREFLAKNDYTSMAPTYAEYYSGAAILNFAATQDGVILYSDLIKVWIDRDTLSIIGFDARNYLYSHVARDFDEPQISMDEAQNALSVAFEIKSRSIALIPLTPETEKLCYEFRGVCGNDEYIIYVNAISGEEEQVLLIINSEYGQLTI